MKWPLLAGRGVHVPVAVSWSDQLALHCLQARNAAEFRRAHAHMPFIAGAGGRWLFARTWLSLFMGMGWLI